MKYTNAQILAAILAKWMQPITAQMTVLKLSNIPAIASAENIIRTFLPMPPNWSLGNELAQYIPAVMSSGLEPLLTGLLSGIPDSAIPALIRPIVDKGIADGGMALLAGNITFTKEDLIELKKYIDYNMPEDTQAAHYEVRTDGPAPAQEEMK